MLAAHNRLRRRADFVAAARRGRRVGGATLVVHVLVAPGDGPPRVGFVVSKAVGGSVVRNRVTRRLRAVARDRVDRLPPGGILVVRALPRSASASSAELAADLDLVLERALPGGPR